jgi:hypothetical protein
MKTLLLTLALLAQPLLADDLEWQAASPIWQVRYCLTARFPVADPTARRLLEKLCTDAHPGVAQQAWAHYSRLFVDLDPALVRTAFQRGDFNLDGVTVDSPKVFATPAFWIGDIESCRRRSPDLQARGIHALGLCGTKDNLPLLLEFRTSTDPYLLHELALALRRLGDDASYLTVIHTLLSLPPATAIDYQTAAIDSLLQTHPALARQHWDKLHAAVVALPDLQPGWMCAHILQQRRLP